jgi:hypothetical protein
MDREPHCYFFDSSLYGNCQLGSILKSGHSLDALCSLIAWRAKQDRRQYHIPFLRGPRELSILQRRRLAVFNYYTKGSLAHGYNA